jgi:hypothetical protein
MRNWSSAIQSAVENEDPVQKRKRLHLIAERLVQMAQDGDMQAIKELGDRIDGRPAAQLPADLSDEQIKGATIVYNL